MMISAWLEVKRCAPYTTSMLPENDPISFGPLFKIFSKQMRIFCPFHLIDRSFKSLTKFGKCVASIKFGEFIGRLAHVEIGSKNTNYQCQPCL